VMKLYAHHGIHDFILCLGYRGQMIKEYFLNYKAMSNDFTIKLGSPGSVTYHETNSDPEFTVTLADTGAETMTGGRIARVARYVDGNRFCVAYGDGVADVDISKVLDFHRTHGKLATVTATRPPSRFGVLDVATDGTVKHFAEKPQLDNWASCGYFVFEKQVLDLLDNDSCVLEREPLERLALDGQLAAYRHDGFYFAMDTHREYLALNELWNSGAPPWKVWD